jgi:beta-glucanase (GH16 family)
MASAVITAYLSPDGEWKTQTANGSADIKTKAKAGVAPEDIGTISVKTKKAPLLILKDAPKLPSLKEAGLTEEPAFVDEFDPDWPKKDAWQVATWKQNGTQMAPERCRVDAQGHLVQTVLAGKPFLGGSVQSTKEYGYGRWIARLKPTSVPGVLNSMFTKDWEDMTTPTPHDGGKAEIDIELLSHTYAPGKGEVHLAIHLKDRPAVFQVDVPLDFNPSDDFHEWGFDVLPDRVVWHVDGRIVHEWKYTKELSVAPGYEMFFNSWTMEKWIKGPPAAEADYRIDWVKFYPVAKSEAKPTD